LGIAGDGVMDVKGAKFKAVRKAIRDLVPNSRNNFISKAAAGLAQSFSTICANPHSLRTCYSAAKRFLKSITHLLTGLCTVFFAARGLLILVGQWCQKRGGMIGIV
jgi:hypothetical protein